MAMSDDLFQNPNISVFDTLRYVFQLYKKRWGLFVQLGCASLIFTVLCVTPFILLTWYIIPDEILEVAKLHLQDDVGEKRRVLQTLANHVTSSTGGNIHHVVGHAASRLLQASYENNVESYYSIDPDQVNKIIETVAAAISTLSGTTIAALIFVTIACSHVILYISSTFQAAMIHTASATLVDSTPTFSKVTQPGGEAAHKMTMLQWLVWVSLLMLIGVNVATTTAIIWNDTSSAFSFLFILLIQLTSLYSILTMLVVMYTATPSIVVERQSVIGSMKRSLQLCKDKYCFILGSVFFLLLLLAVVKEVIGDALYSIVMTPMQAIMATTIYTALRIQKDGVNKATLAQELGLSANYAPLIGRDEEDAVRKEVEVLEVATPRKT